MLLLYGRPALLVRDGRLAPVPAFWNLLEDQRDDIEMVQRGVGRIELFGHPEYDWAGSGFLVGETTLLTSRRVAELFVERQGEAFQFRPGITAWLDYRAEEERQASAGCRVRGVIGVHKDYDLALLDVEPPQNPSGSAPTILALAAQAPERLEGRPVYQDTRRSEPERVARICRDVYNVKRVQPGILRGTFPFGAVQLLTHDCGGLGHSAGGCVVDLETHQVLGLQTTGRYLENSTAVPLWVLRDDPLFRQARVNFAQASPQDVERTNDEIERLARTPYWKDLRQVITALYQRAFGRGDVGE